MCLNCWQEAGSPTELPPNANDLITMINELYSTEKGSTGGPLHIVLDDWNLEDDNIEWCMLRMIESAEDREQFGEDILRLSIKIGLRLYRMPKNQRYALLKEQWVQS
jgi:hypothetical protein